MRRGGCARGAGAGAARPGRRGRAAAHRARGNRPPARRRRPRTPAPNTTLTLDTPSIRSDKARPAQRLVRVEHGLEGPRVRPASLPAGARRPWSGQHICRANRAAPSRADRRHPCIVARRRRRSSRCSRGWRRSTRRRAPSCAYADPFTLLVAVVLSAQATDVGVNKATKALFAAAPTPAAMVALGEERVREHIKTIGLFRNKARNVVALSRMLLERHGGEVPREPRGARGAARASAARPPTSCSTRRSASRRSRSTPTSSASPTAPAWRPARRPRRSRPAAGACVPPAFKHGAHHWLILHGRYVCLARRPLCPACAMRDICRYPGQDRRPRPRKRGAAQSGS